MTPGRASSGEAPRLTLAALAGMLGGTVEGDGSLEITGVATLREAGPAEISFFASPRFSGDLAATGAGAVIAGAGADLGGRSGIRVDNPHLAFARAIGIFHPPVTPAPGVHPTAVVEEGAAVDPTATVGALCFVGSGAVVGARTVLGPHCVVGAGASVGANVLLHPRVTLADRVRVGDRVVIHSGAVVGSDGFGYVPEGGRHLKVPQVGTVEIGDDVEIGANVTIDRATVGTTRIGEGTKIDNLVQIAHNVEVGRHSIVVAQVGVSGSSRIGDRVVLGGQVGIVGHVTIGDGARIGAQSGVMNSVPAGETFSGTGPLPHRRWLRAQAVYEHLPELRSRVRELERRMEEHSGSQEK